MKSTKQKLLLFLCCFALAGTLLWTQNAYAASRTQQNQSITKKECRQLAKSKVKHAKITSIHKKNDDGITIYKVHMQNNKKEYSLKYHAKTGTLLEYEWELLNIPRQTRR